MLSNAIYVMSYPNPNPRVFTQISTHMLSAYGQPMPSAKETYCKLQFEGMNPMPCTCLRFSPVDTSEYRFVQYAQRSKTHVIQRRRDRATLHSTVISTKHYHRERQETAHTPPL
jgi:hypothetical protein